MATGSVLVQSTLRERIKSFDADVRVGEEFTASLDTQVNDLIKKAIERCKANGRKTLGKADL